MEAIVVVDIGTTRSGVSYCYLSNPSEILCEQNWENEKVGTKTRTHILLTEEGTLVSFGQRALDEYMEADSWNLLDCIDDDGKGADDAEEWIDTHTPGVIPSPSANPAPRATRATSSAKDLLFFRNFKLDLYGTTASMPEIKAVNSDKTLPAYKIFGAALAFFKSHMEMVFQRSEFPVSKIHWCLTVPAIWSEGAKQVMTRAAVHAGLVTREHEVTIVLEPEAAALRCRALQHPKTSAPASRFMVVDAGGGTLDVTLYRVTPTTTLQELSSRSGDCLGSTAIDGNFLSLLESVFGTKIVDNYRRFYPQEYEEALVNFENVKTTVDARERTRKVRMPQFLDCVWNEAECDPADFTADHTGVDFKRGVLVLSHTRIMALFAPVMDAIVAHLGPLLDNSECTALYLVGGLGSSEVLHNRLVQEFKSLTVIRPPKASLAVLMGGVMYAHQPNVIAARISKYGYGIAIRRPFDKTTHPPKKMITHSSGKSFCEGFIRKYVRAGDCLDAKHTVEKRFYPFEDRHDSISLAIYQLSTRSARFIDDEGCTLLGKLRVKSPHTELPASQRPIRVKMHFAGPKIFVEAADEASGQSCEATFSCLVEE